MIAAPIASVRTAINAKSLAKLEAKVDVAEASYIDVGHALEGIRDLFYAAGQKWEDFADHCEQVWNWPKTTVDDKIAAAEIAVSLRNSGVVPPNMHVALALRPLDQSDRAKVWKQIITEFRGKRITGEAARMAVATFNNTTPAGKLQEAGTKAFAGMAADDVEYIADGKEKHTQADAPARVRGETDQASVISNILSKVAALAKLIDQWEGDRDLALKKINQLKAIFQE